MHPVASTQEKLDGHLLEIAWIDFGLLDEVFAPTAHLFYARTHSLPPKSIITSTRAVGALSAKPKCCVQFVAKRYGTYGALTKAGGDFGAGVESPMRYPITHPPVELPHPHLP